MKTVPAAEVTAILKTMAAMYQIEVMKVNEQSEARARWVQITHSDGAVEAVRTDIRPVPPTAALSGRCAFAIAPLPPVAQASRLCSCLCLRSAHVLKHPVLSSSSCTLDGKSPTQSFDAFVEDPPEIATDVLDHIHALVHTTPDAVDANDAVILDQIATEKTSDSARLQLEVSLLPRDALERKHFVFTLAPKWGYGSTRVWSLADITPIDADTPDEPEEPDTRDDDDGIDSDDPFEPDNHHDPETPEPPPPPPG